MGDSKCLDSLHGLEIISICFSDGLNVGYKKKEEIRGIKDDSIVLF